MTEFTELYKKLSNSGLLTIIAEADKYNPVAVETAKAEIENRQLTEEQFHKAQLKIAQKKNAKKLETERLTQHKESLQKSASTLFDTINPIQKEALTTEKIIRLTTLIFGVIALYGLYQKSTTFQIMFHEGISDWDFSMVEYLLPAILLPIAIIIYYKRNKIGWILLAIFLTYSTFGAIVLFFMNLNSPSITVPGLENMFPIISPAAHLLSSLFYGGFLFLNCKKMVRDIFKISNKTMGLTITLSLVVITIYTFTIFG